jgi:hypothetical protein
MIRAVFTDLFSSILPGYVSQKKDVVYLQGAGNYEMDIAGEEGYQAELEELCGPRQPDGVRQLEVARLVLDPKRGYSANKNAIRVEIRGKQVGYLSVQATIHYRRYLAAKDLPNTRGQCPAVIWGGWVTPDGSTGPYYVSLDMPDLAL